MKIFKASWLIVASLSLSLVGCGEDGPTTKSVGLDSGSNSGGSNGNGGGTPQPNSGRLQFTVSSLDVAESAGTATLTITRTAGSEGVATVTITSRDGTATAPADYSAVSTTVTFAAGDSTSRTVSIPVVDDDVDEPDETLYVTLVSATGATLGSIREVLITINDDDVTAPAAPKAVLSAAYRKLHVDWTPVDGATSYRLMKDSTGNGDFTQVGADLGTDERSVDFEVILHKEDWLNTRYAIAACNSAGCTQSAPMSAADLSTPLIGYLKASNTHNDVYFGFSMAMSADGNVLAVGAIYEDGSTTGVGAAAPTDCEAAVPVNCSYDSGAVYVYTKTASGWSAPVYIKADHIGSNQSGDNFGSSLALNADGTTLAVGARYEDSSVGGIDAAAVELANSSGAVHVYTRSGTTWTPAAFIKTPTPQPYTYFGTAVALSADGNTLVASAPGEASAATGIGGTQAYDCSASPATNCALNSGAVYVFTRTAGVWSDTPTYIKASNTRPGMLFGSAVALSADGNTLVIGAADEGSSATGIGGNAVYDCDVSPAVNCANSSGAAYVYTRSDSTWNSSPAYLKPGNTVPYMYFGATVAISADGNTVAIGATGEASSSTGIDGDPESDCYTTGTHCSYSSGAVYTYVRGSGAWATDHYIKAPNTGEYDNFGAALALNADGTALTVTAPGEGGSSAGVDGADNDLMFGAGAAYFYTRSGSTWAAPRYIKASNPEMSDSFGSSVALSGDGSVLAVGATGEESAATGFNGNQLDDCGSMTETNCAWTAGAAYVYQ